MKTLNIILSILILGLITTFLISENNKSEPLNSYFLNISHLSESKNISSERFDFFVNNLRNRSRIDFKGSVDELEWHIMAAKAQVREDVIFITPFQLSVEEFETYKLHEFENLLHIYDFVTVSNYFSIVSVIEKQENITAEQSEIVMLFNELKQSLENIQQEFISTDIYSEYLLSQLKHSLTLNYMIDFQSISNNDIKKQILQVQQHAANTEEESLNKLANEYRNQNINILTKESTDNVCLIEVPNKLSISKKKIGIVSFKTKNTNISPFPCDSIYHNLVKLNIN